MISQRQPALTSYLTVALSGMLARSSGAPARSKVGLPEWAVEELGGDLVVVGSSSRRGVGRILAGNVALQLLHGSP